MPEYQYLIPLTCAGIHRSSIPGDTEPCLDCDPGHFLVKDELAEPFDKAWPTAPSLIPLIQALSEQISLPPCHKGAKRYLTNTIYRLVNNS